MVFLFPRAFSSQASKFYLIIFTVFLSWICPGDSRWARGQGEAGWHPALLPTDSRALLREPGIQQWCAKQDLRWICKSQVKLAAKAFKKQNSLLTRELIKCDMPSPWRISLKNSKVKSAGWLFRCHSLILRWYWKIPEANSGLYPEACKMTASNNPRAVHSLHSFVPARKWYFLFRWRDIWHCNWSLVLKTSVLFVNQPTLSSKCLFLTWGSAPPRLSKKYNNLWSLASMNLSFYWH